MNKVLLDSFWYVFTSTTVEFVVPLKVVSATVFVTPETKSIPNPPGATIQARSNKRIIEKPAKAGLRNLKAR